MDRLSARLQSASASPRSSSRSLVPMRRLNTIKESGGAGDQPAPATHPHSPSPGGHFLDERHTGRPGGSSFGAGRTPAPAPRKHSSDRAKGDEDPADTELPRGGMEPVRPPQLPPPCGWVPENRDPRENGAGNPLLRHSSQGSRGSGRT